MKMALLRSLDLEHGISLVPKVGFSSGQGSLVEYNGHLEFKIGPRRSDYGMSDCGWRAISVNCLDLSDFTYVRGYWTVEGFVDWKGDGIGLACEIIDENENNLNDSGLINGRLSVMSNGSFTTTEYVRR